MNTFLIILSIITAIIVSIIIFTRLAPVFGGKPSGLSLERIRNSPNFNGKVFINQIPTPMMVSGRGPFRLLTEFFKKGLERTPKTAVPFVKEVLAITPGTPKRNAENLSVRWFGHSTNLIEIGGLYFLTDPVFSQYASPLPFMGPRAFPGSLPYTVGDLPDIDIVLLSHDHYDHLDYPTIKKLNDRTSRFIVSLGVGAHLLKWGVASEKIVELDWWEEIEISASGGDKVTLCATPQRHFSGRGTANRNTTLWCSYVIRSRKHTAFFGGDGGYSPVFAEIGQKFGPFDVCLLECGAYSPYWPNIHSLPEQTVQASIDLKSELLIPIHWGKFNLSIHPWKEPVERLSKNATERKVKFRIPIIGGRMDF